MGKTVREIEEERLVLRFMDEFDRSIGVATGDGALIRWTLDLPLISHERNVVGAKLLSLGQGEVIGFHDLIHVVGIRDAEIAVESVTGGEELRKMSEVPLPNAGCGVTLLFEGFGNGDLV